MIRVVSSFSIAVLLSISFLLVLKSSIEIKGHGINASTNLRVINFIRLKRNEKLVKKERVLPQKPKHEKPLTTPRIDTFRLDLPKQTKKLPLTVLTLKLPVIPNADSALNNGLVSGFGDRTINASVIPLVRINPIYPKRARKLKKEGFVNLDFTITAAGSVTDVNITDSNPPKLFDRAASRALQQWKFKPKFVQNRAVTQRASVRIEFKLNH